MAGTRLGPFDVPGYHVGDCRELLRQLPDGCINCCMTSPPYWGLRDYGEPGQLGLEATPEEYVANMVGVFHEVKRVLRDDGILFLNLGDSYAGQMGGKQGASGDRADRAFTGTMEGTRAGNGLKPKDLVGIPWMVAFALRSDGWYLRSDIIWAKSNPMPESVTDRCTKSHEYLFMLAKSEQYYYDADAIREPHVSDGRGGISNKSTLKSVLHEQTHAPSLVDAQVNAAGRNRRTVWTIPTEPTPDAHFATFPRALVHPCILAGCPVGGVVLDPFGGSGTVGRVAEDNGRRWLLFDLSPKYAEIAKRKTAQTGLLGRVTNAS